MIPDVKPELENLLKRIANKSMYYGNKVPPSVMRLLEVHETELTCGILAPFWLGVLQRGRGPRRSKKDHGLRFKIYAWMAKRGMFKSDTPAGKMREAKYLTWYINKYGNKQFRNRVFVDIWKTERDRTVKQIYAKYDKMIGQITMDVI